MFFQIKCNWNACTGQGEEFLQTNPSHEFQNCSFHIRKSIVRLFSQVNIEFLFTPIKHISLSGQYKNTPSMTVRDYSDFGYYVSRDPHSYQFSSDITSIVQQHRLIKIISGVFLQRLQSWDSSLCLLKIITFENI